MTGDDGFFDERVAARYDESSRDMFAPEAVEPVVAFLAALAGDGRALELGIGTGRIALPLAQRGVQGLEIGQDLLLGHPVERRQWLVHQEKARL